MTSIQSAIAIIQAIKAMRIYRALGEATKNTKLVDKLQHPIGSWSHWTSDVNQVSVSNGRFLFFLCQITLDISFKITRRADTDLQRYLGIVQRDDRGASGVLAMRLTEFFHSKGVRFHIGFSDIEKEEYFPYIEVAFPASYHDHQDWM
jgi:hypothetical protein